MSVPPQRASGCSLAGVTVRYRAGGHEAALEGIDLRLDAGEQIAIVGPSGAGKSTLLLALACGVRPAGGEVGVLGERPWTLDRRALQRLRGRLFLAPQVPPLPPRQRVVHAVLAGRLPAWSTWRAIASLLRPNDVEAAHAALARFKVDDKLFLRCDRLSGGERQRVGLARALTSPAELLLLDEPVSALDPALALAALETLQAEARARAATMIVSLHAIDLALARFARIVGVRAGRIAFDLPRPQVTPELLAALYGDEADQAAQDPAAAALPVAPIFSRCS